MSVFPTVSDHRAANQAGTTALLRLRALELRERTQRVAQFLEQQRLDGLWLSRRENIFWFTSTGVDWPTTTHPARHNGILLIDRQPHLLVNLEAWNTHASTFTELQQQLNADLHLYGADDGATLLTLLGQFASNRQIGTDRNMALPNFQLVAHEFARLRLTLSPTEQYSYRLLSRDMTHILQSVARRIRDQQTEREIAAEIAHQCYLAGIQPTTLLVSADSGIRRYRHPSPREHTVTRYAILVLTGTRGGMHASLTRIVAVDHLPPRLEDKHRLATYLNALCMTHTRPGQNLDAAQQQAAQAFEHDQHPTDWRVRFRGDVLDYATRDTNRVMFARQPVETYQAIAWSSAVNGIQAEDTVLVMPDQHEILTCSEGWPVIEMEIDRKPYFRPDILRL